MILDTDVLVDLHRGFSAAERWLASLTDVPAMAGMAAMEEDLATFNVKHFRAVPGLITVQPYVR